MGKLIGIDLGTTHSRVAVLANGLPQVIANSAGNRMTPSVVAFTQSGECLVGLKAKQQAVANPENTIASVKRLLGRRFTDPGAQNTKAMVSYPVVEGPNHDARVAIRHKNKVYPPQKIIAMLLGQLKHDAETYLGEAVTEAVITAPAYFDSNQRQALKDAGRIAGLEVRSIINEPSAAVLGCGLSQTTEGAILVLHLGGGAFDVSVIEVYEGVIEVKAISGDTQLGGDDWDWRIVQWLLTTFKTEQGIDLSQDSQALQRLREAAAKAKSELSATLQTEINLPSLVVNSTGPKNLIKTLTRAQFEQLTADLVERCKTPFYQALKDAHCDVTDLQAVVLVGGGTRMPQVQALVRSLTGGKTSYQGVNPDEVIALGAAVQTGLLGGEVSDLVLLDVIPQSVGIEMSGGVMTVQIERNTTMPARKSQVFSTAVDNQPSLIVEVFQGEQIMARANKPLGTIELLGIPPEPRGVPQIEVTFAVEHDGILAVTAKDARTGKDLRTTSQNSIALSASEIEQLASATA